MNKVKNSSDLGKAHGRVNLTFSKTCLYLINRILLIESKILSKILPILLEKATHRNWIIVLEKKNIREVNFNLPDKYQLPYNFASEIRFSFSFCLVESRYHKMIRTYRSNFKTLEFGSKSNILNNFALKHSR